VLGWILGVISVVVVVQTFAFADVPHGNEDHPCFPVDTVTDTANVLFTPPFPAAFHQTGTSGRRKGKYFIIILRNKRKALFREQITS